MFLILGKFVLYREESEKWDLSSLDSYGGNVDITINGRVEGNQINTMVLEIMRLIESGNIKGEFAISLGPVSLNL